MKQAPFYVFVILLVSAFIVRGCNGRNKVSNRDDYRVEKTTQNNQSVGQTYSQEIIVNSFEYPSEPQWKNHRGINFSYDTEDFLRILDADGNEYDIGPDVKSTIPDAESNRIWYVKLRKSPPKGKSAVLSIFNIHGKENNNQTYSSPVIASIKN